MQTPFFLLVLLRLSILLFGPRIFSFDGYSIISFWLSILRGIHGFIHLSANLKFLKHLLVYKNLLRMVSISQIVTFYSDNGGEFQALTPFLSKNGISHHTSAPHTPEHNGISECNHRHIVETGLALLTHAHMPLEY